jgi:signal recognition particle GTPase
MMFDGISDRVSDALQRINGVQRISEASVAGALKDVKRALLVFLAYAMRSHTSSLAFF